LPGGITKTAKNDTGGGFKPKFPVHCRPLDFDQWMNFRGKPEMQIMGEEVAVRCQRLYADAKLQPKALSGESLKVCQDSYTRYNEWQVTPGNEGVRRMFCNVAKMNEDTQMVKMHHYLDTKLVGSALTVDHDVMMQFLRWYDETNLQLFDQWKRGEIGGEEAPKVSDACANAYGNMMCSNILPNCTYMPLARWPYHEQHEKIYICKEICEKVKASCHDSWLPHPVRCEDFVSEEKDWAVDPKWTMTAFDRFEKGGHACSHVEMTVEFRGGAAQLTPWRWTLFTIVLLAVVWSTT